MKRTRMRRKLRKIQENRLVKSLMISRQVIRAACARLCEGEVAGQMTISSYELWRARIQMHYALKQFSFLPFVKAYLGRDAAWKSPHLALMEMTANGRKEVIVPLEMSGRDVMKRLTQQFQQTKKAYYYAKEPSVVDMTIPCTTTPQQEQ